MCFSKHVYQSSELLDIVASIKSRSGFAIPPVKHRSNRYCVHLLWQNSLARAHSLDVTTQKPEIPADLVQSRRCPHISGELRSSDAYCMAWQSRGWANCKMDNNQFVHSGVRSRRVKRCPQIHGMSVSGIATQTQTHTAHSIFTPFAGGSLFARKYALHYGKYYHVDCVYVRERMLQTSTVARRRAARRRRHTTHKTQQGVTRAPRDRLQRIRSVSVGHARWPPQQHATMAK